MSHHLENQENHEKQPAVTEKGAENLTQEAVHDAFGKGGKEGSFKNDSNSKATDESAKKALPDLEITNDANGEMSMQGAKGNKEAMKKLEELRKDPNGQGGGGKIDRNNENSMKGARNDKEAMKQLEELQKDPNGKGGGGKIELRGVGGGGRAGGGKIDLDELQKGGPAGGNAVNRLEKGEQMPKGTAGGGGFRGGKSEEVTFQSGTGKDLPKAEPKDIGPYREGVKMVPADKVKKPVIEQKTK